MAESEKELKSLLRRVKEESKKLAVSKVRYCKIKNVFLKKKKLAENSTFKKSRSWYLVPSLHGK